MLTITTTHEPATDLGYLLHKHPGKVQEFSLAFGTAHVFYPEATEQRCTAALLMEVDPVRLTRGNGSGQPGQFLQDYINDRPYAAGSHLSVAIAQVYRTAMAGRCDAMPELAAKPIPLRARVCSVRARYGPELMERFLKPLGYEIETSTLPMDPEFPEWGESHLHNLVIESGERTLSELLRHLYVLLPRTGQPEALLDRPGRTGEDAAHGGGLAREPPGAGDNLEALPGVPARVDPAGPGATGGGRLRGRGHRSGNRSREQSRERTKGQKRKSRPPEIPEGENSADAGAGEAPPEPELAAAAARITESVLEKPMGLHAQRIQAVREEVEAAGARSVLDLGCGDGKLLQELVKLPGIRLTGLEVSGRHVGTAQRKLRSQAAGPGDQERLKVLHGSLIYQDPRMDGHDAAVAMEVIEHIDPSKLEAFEEVVLGSARPGTLIVTTPNVEYNVLFENMEARFRHRDHRFEWTRAEFQQWAEDAAGRRGYAVRFRGIGPGHEAHGCPTQMAVFKRD